MFSNQSPKKESKRQPKKNWAACLAQDKQEKTVVLEKSFAGIKAGSTLYVGTPKIIDAYIRKLKPGTSSSMVKMRNQLARKKKADAMCPTSSSIFTRIVAEAAYEQIESGMAVDKVTPFWRLIAPTDAIAKRLSCDEAWIAHQRESEGIL